MKLLLIFFALIFLLYLFYNPRMKTKESFEDIKSLSSDKIFKENHDLNYLNIRTGKDITKSENVKTQRMAPINNPGLGKDKFPKTVSAQDFLPSTRVPDDLSDLKSYKIPMPQFDDRLETNIVKKTDNLNNKKKIVTSEISRKKYKRPKKIKKIKKFGKACKFISSFEQEDFKCPKEFPVYTGATFGVKGTDVSCNGEKIKMVRAQAMASIKNGHIKSIIVTEGGENYKRAPTIKISGDGVGASAYAIVDNGKVTKIVVTDGGKNYNSTPTIKISQPSLAVNCNLCCKSEL